MPETAALLPSWLQLMADSFWPLLHAGIRFTVPLTLISFGAGLMLACVVALIRLFGQVQRKRGE